MNKKIPSFSSLEEIMVTEVARGGTLLTPVLQAAIADTAELMKEGSFEDPAFKKFTMMKLRSLAMKEAIASPVGQFLHVHQLVRVSEASVREILISAELILELNSEMH